MPDTGHPLPIDPDERRRELGRRRGRRHYRRAHKGRIYVRGDLPTDISEWMIRRGFRIDTGSTDPNEWFDAMLEVIRSEMKKT